jgi:multiple sugar transport system ATP-binding protein
MRTEISRLHQRLKTTMVYVTHDQVEAMTMGDRIVVMHKGEVQDINTPLGLYNAPRNRFVAGFIGSPPMNFVKGRICAEHGALHFVSDDGQVHLSIPIEKQSALQGYIDRPVIFGVRPEDLHEARAVGDGATRIEVLIDVVEPMGSETNVYFVLGGTQATARLRAESLPAENAIFPLEVDMAKSHFFDPASEQKIA